MEWFWEAVLTKVNTLEKFVEIKLVWDLNCDWEAELEADKLYQPSQIIQPRRILINSRSWGE